jgi:hypothetical protein
MQTWLPFFVMVTAVAVVIQMIILAALFFQLRRLMEEMNRVFNDLNARLGPILTRVQILLEETQPRISNLVADASHIVYLARTQAQKVDRVFTDAADRLRAQLVHADRILTGALEAVEEAGSQFRRNVWGPFHKASALIQGIKVGLDFFRSRRRSPSPAPDDSAGAAQEEELFI